MAINQLTDKGIRSIKKPGKYADGQNLFLRVRDTGSKTFYFMSYYDNLARAIDAEAPAFLASMLSRDIGTFSPDAPPPMTDAKDELIRSSRSAAVQNLDAILFDEAACVPELVNLTRLQAALRPSLGRFPGTGEVARAMRSLNCRPVRALRIGEGTIRLWAKDNIDQWQDADAEAMRSYIDSLEPGVTAAWIYD